MPEQRTPRKAGPQSPGPYARYAELYPSVWRRVQAIAESQNPALRDKARSLTAQLARRESVRETRLAESHCLTPSEARLAAHIAGGGTVASYATRHGVSQGTARTHLRAIFAKIGVHRQADLVRLLAAPDR